MVDLSAENITTINTTDYLPKWVGGRGIGAKIHWDMVGPEVKAFDPENVLSLIGGACTGIVDTRLVVQAVSPLGYPTESYYRSTMGSHFGAELKFAGWDGIVLVGKAAKLSYLLIENDQVSIRDGNELYQLDTYATQQHLWSRHTPKHRVCLIGPAGENLVRDAHLQADDHNACGLGGFGAVMGSKNLKAIAVRGTLGSPPIASVKDVLIIRAMEGAMMEPFPGVGAAAGSQLELAGQTGEARLGMAGCFGCQMPCGYAVKWKDGSTVAMGNVKCGEFISCSAELAATGEYVGKNQWKRITQQGLLGITGQPSYRYVIQNDLENYYDEPITLLHHKIITEEDLDIPYIYGTPEFTNEFNRKLAYRQGEAMTALGEGQGKFCYEYLKTPEAIKDYEENCMRAGTHGFCPGFYIHLYRSLGLLMRMTSTINSGDQRGMYHYLFPMYPLFKDNAEMYGASFATWEWTYAPQAVKMQQDFKTAMDLTVRCYYNVGTPLMAGYPELMRNLQAAISGMAYDEQAEQDASDCVWLLERSIMTRQGHTKADDDLFDSAWEMVAPYGVKAEDGYAARDVFYQMRGVDVETALPTKTEYSRLGMSDIASRLESEYDIALPA
jgi:aldehyde:ferredoxin oxidoreductase